MLNNKNMTYPNLGKYKQDLPCQQVRDYHKVASSNTSRLAPCPSFYRLLMKGIFDACAYAFCKKFIFELVTRVRTHDSTVFKSALSYQKCYRLVECYSHKCVLGLGFKDL